MGAFFRAWLRERAASIGAFFFAVAMFALSFAYFELPLAAVVWPSLAAALVRLLLALAAYRHAVRRRRLFEQLAGLPPARAAERVPPAETAGEADYEALLRALLHANQAESGAAAERGAAWAESAALWAERIRAPLASMRAALQTPDPALTRRLEPDLARAEQTVDLALLALRMDGGGAVWTLRACDLDAVIRGVVRRYTGVLIERGLRLYWEPLRAVVRSDAQWLSYVLDQVLSNAVKFTAAGSVSIYLEPEMILCIADTGIGMAPEELSRLFDPGRIAAGSGAGLYLAREVCRRLGHSMTVSSAVGRGTCVRIDLSRAA